MLEQYDAAKDLRLRPIAHDVQQTEWVLFESFIIRMVEVDIECISSIKKK